MVKHKINIFNWAGERRVNEVLTLFGREHNEVVEDDLMILVQNFLSEGLNTMILHGQPGVCDYVLALDTKSFRQR